MSDKNTGFNASYKKLNDIAKKLREQQEPDIDSLLPMITEATDAYANCKQRLEQVKVALDKHFAEHLSDVSD